MDFKLIAEQTDNPLLLEYIAQTKPAAHLNVAANPHALPQTLWDICERNGYKVIAKVLEHPKVDEAFVEKLLDRIGSLSLLPQLTRFPRILERVLLENAPSLTSRILLNLALDAPWLPECFWQLFEAKLPEKGVFLSRIRVPAEVTQRVMEKLDPSARAFLACNPWLDPQTAEVLAQDPCPRVRREILLHQSHQLPERIWRSLLAQKEVTLGIRVDNLKKIPHNLLLSLMEIEPKVCEDIAHNPTAPGDLLAQAETIAKEAIHRALLANPNTPPALLAKIAQSGDPEFKEILARHQNTPPEILRSLAGDSDPQVHKNLAGNPSTPKDVVEQLISRGDDELLYYCSFRKDLSAEAVKELVFKRKAGLLQPLLNNYVLDRELQLSLLQLEHGALRLAEYPHCAEDILRLLSTWPLSCVRGAVACHPQVPEEVLNRLSQDPDCSVRESAARYVRDPQAQLLLAEDRCESVAVSLLNNPNITEAALKRLAFSNYPSVLIKLASHPLAPAEALYRLSQNPNQEVRALVAIHRNAPEEALLRLSKDRKREIKYLALCHPRLPLRRALQMINLKDGMVQKILRLRAQSDPTLRRALLLAEAFVGS